MGDLNLTHHEVVNDFLLLQWMDGSENAILLKGVRDNCHVPIVQVKPMFLAMCIRGRPKV